MYLECRDISKAFGETAVLRRVGFSLPRGECLALLGASGCGKTTLLNIVAGFLRADAGRVSCGDDVLDEPDTGRFRPAAKRDFAMVFQDFSLWPHLTVGENVAYGLKIRGVPRSAREARALEALRRVGLEAAAGRPPATLSGGQQQRVAIARALVVEPRVLLLDEPLSALDAHLRESLRDELARLIRSLGMTAIYVTHDQSEALALARRVAVMRAGVIEQLDTPERIYREPATAYVASFLGGASILAFERRDGRFWLGGRVALDPAGTDGCPSDGGLCALRKEAVTVRPGNVPGPAGSAARLSGRCERVRFLGERYETFVDVPDVGLVGGYAAVAPAPGEPVTVEFEPRQLREVKA